MEMRSHFGFNASPFTRELRVEQRFRLPQFDEAVVALQAAVEARQSAALIAPAGTGKTLVARTLRDALPEARYEVHYVKTTSLSRRDMCRELAMAVGAKPAGNYPALVRQLQDRFQGSFDNDGLRPVIIADDAHEMRPETLGLFRLLTNFDMDSRLVVSIVLLGQPPLRHLLQRGELEDIARRLVHYAELRLLSRDETRAYVEHRLTIAGAKKVPFDAGALDAIYELSRGNLRAIDHLAGKALELAAARKEHAANAAHLMEARKVLWP